MTALAAAQMEDLTLQKVSLCIRVEYTLAYYIGKLLLNYSKVC